jgi:hypothetical protein
MAVGPMKEPIAVYTPYRPPSNDRAWAPDDDGEKMTSTMSDGATRFILQPEKPVEPKKKKKKLGLLSNN